MPATSTPEMTLVHLSPPSVVRKRPDVVPRRKVFGPRGFTSCTRPCPSPIVRHVLPPSVVRNPPLLPTPTKAVPPAGVMDRRFVGFTPAGGLTVPQVPAGE